MRLPLPGPAALARALRGLTGGADDAGLAWLDRAHPAADDERPDARRTSLLAASPTGAWTGRSEAEWEAFAHAWKRRAKAEPGAVAVGWVEYGGDFRFVLYPQPALYEHSAGSEPAAPGEWRFPGGEPPWWAEAVRQAAWGSPPAESETLGVDLSFREEMPAVEYVWRVRRAQEFIAAGDVYQVNLAHRLVAAWPEGADPFALYLRLREISPAPEAAFLEGGGRSVLCASPELFLELDGRCVRTRPIKGTRPRRADLTEDEAEARALLASAKERAELLMITDLLRNDLGRLCEFGAVRVPELLRLERHAQVFHLVSTVEGLLRPDVSHPAALRACLPGGSITGAPKRRARQVIAELEAPVPRGLYTGSLGVFAPGEWSRFNVVIRTLIVENGEAHFHVGAGIVADSVPELEHAETLHKAAGILRAATRGERSRG